MREFYDAADKLAEKYKKMEEARNVYETLKKDYEEYAIHTVPDIFFNAGVSNVGLADGRTVAIVARTVCNINKQKKNEIAQWLESHGGGNLVYSQNIVNDTSLLEKYNIPYEKTVEMNTNSVKAWVMDALGQKGGVAQITTQDIPKGLNFFQFNMAEVRD